MRPFGCPVTILNTLDPLGKFDRKANEGFLVGYSINSKAFRVFNTRTRKVEKNLHINFLENKPNVAGSSLEWLFDIDLLTKSMHYEPVTAGNQTNCDAGIETNVNAGQAGQEKASDHEYILLPLILSNSPLSLSSRSTNNKDADEVPEKGDDDLTKLDNLLVQQKKGYANNTNKDSTVSPFVSTAGQNFTTANDLLTDPLIPDLEDTGIFSGAYDDEDMGAEADLNNLEITMNVSPIPITRIHKYHPKYQIIGDIISATQKRRMTKITEEHTMVWTLVDLPKGKRDIGTKLVYRNKKDERGIVVRNKERLVAQGYTQEEGIDYDEVLSPVARIEAIRLFLAYASFMGLIVYQMDVKSAFLYGTIEEEVYVYQPPSFADPQFPDKVYKVEKALYGLHQAPRAWCMLRISSLDLQRRLQVIQKDDGIFISQDKYVADILKKFDFVTIKEASTPIETNKALNKDEKAEDVDVHLYRSMIRSLMYLTASRPDIMDSPFDLEAFSESDYAGASLDRKSTIGEVGEGSGNPTEPQHISITVSLSNLEPITDETVYKEWADGMERAASTASSLEAEQDSDFYDKHNMVAYLEKSEGSEGFHQIIDFLTASHISTLENGDMEITATIDGKVKVVSEASIRRHLKLEDSDGISTLATLEIFEQLALMGDEGSMTLNELTVLYTTLSKKVETLESDLKQTNLTYGVAYTKLIMKVKKLEHKVKSSKARRRVRLVVSEDEDELEVSSKQGRKISLIDEDEVITLVQMSVQTQGRHEHDFEGSDFKFIAPEEDYTAEPDISTANVPVSIIGAEVSTASPEVKTAAESLVYIRRSAAKRKDKGKAIMKEAEPVQKKTKLQLEQERLGMEEALRLQEQLDEKERQRIARVYEEASTFNAEEWDNIQAKIKVNEELAHKLQAQERERYSEAEKARLILELINERKRKFSQQRAEQRRNKPMT
ncbi:putative ribonuclease H-like domain-containing protein [Tanacetum coccineum]